MYDNGNLQCVDVRFLVLRWMIVMHMDSAFVRPTLLAKCVTDVLLDITNIRNV